MNTSAPQNVSIEVSGVKKRQQKSCCWKGILKENGVVVSDKQSIAELFNNRFVRIAEEVAQLDTADYCEDFRDHPSINAILKNSTGSVFKIQAINSIQIKNLILGIKTRKSCGYDIILPRLVKESADVIV